MGSVLAAIAFIALPIVIVAAPLCYSSTPAQDIDFMYQTMNSMPKLKGYRNERYNVGRMQYSRSIPIFG